MDAFSLEGVSQDLIKVCGGEKNAVYCEYKNNNLIVFESFRSSVFPCDIPIICDYTPEKNFKYIVDLLNNKKNNLIYMTKMPGTSSDYIVYKNLNINELIKMKYRDIIKYLRRLNVNAKNREDMFYKYLIYDNEMFYEIKF